jgi:hypothetical protein
MKLYGDGLANGDGAERHIHCSIPHTMTALSINSCDVINLEAGSGDRTSSERGAKGRRWRYIVLGYRIYDGSAR